MIPKQQKKKKAKLHHPSTYSFSFVLLNAFSDAVIWASVSFITNALLILVVFDILNF